MKSPAYSPKKNAEKDWIPVRIPPKRRKLKRADEVEARLQEYIRECSEQGEPPTYRGLAIVLGLHNEELQMLEKCEYNSIPMEERKRAADVIKLYKNVLGDWYDKRLIMGNGGSGHIFFCKNILGYSDNYQIHSKIEYDVSPQLQQLASQIVSKLPAPPSALPGQPSTQPPEIVIQPTQEPDSDD